MKYITNKVKLYPNKKQIEFFELTFELCRQMYNTLLFYFNSIYLKFSRLRDSNPNFDEKEFASSNKIPNIGVIKKGNKEFKKTDSLALCNEYKNMVRGIQLFYNGNSKKPKFKSKLKNKKSYTTSQVNNNIRIEGRKLRLPKIGFVKARGFREFPECFEIKCVTVYKDVRGYYYANIVYEYPDDVVYNKENKEWEKVKVNKDEEEKVVGLDFKVDNIFVSSDNFTPKFPNKYFYLIKQIPIIQKQLNKKDKYSKNYNKLLDKLRKIHRKIVNIRKDVQHKLSAKLAYNYSAAIIEDISMKKLQNS